MKTICAWCRKTLKEGDAERGVSHGVCRPCHDQVLAQMLVHSCSRGSRRQTDASAQAQERRAA